MSNRKWYIFITVCTLVFALILAFGGCGKKPGIIDPPPANDPPVAVRKLGLVDDRPKDVEVTILSAVFSDIRVSKPSLPKNSASISFTILDEFGRPFQIQTAPPNEFFDNLEFVSMTSVGPNWSKSASVGLNGHKGWFVLVFPEGRSINGYYRVRLKRAHAEAGWFGVLGEWRNVNINNGDNIELIFQVGRQATFLRNLPKSAVSKQLPLPSNELSGRNMAVYRWSMQTGAEKEFKNSFSFTANHPNDAITVLEEVTIWVYHDSAYSILGGYGGGIYSPLIFYDPSKITKVIPADIWLENGKTYYFEARATVSGFTMGKSVLQISVDGLQPQILKEKHVRN